MVTALVDMLILLQMPAAGDELQAMKKGINELADLILVNKADGELATAVDPQSKLAAKWGYVKKGSY